MNDLKIGKVCAHGGLERQCLTCEMAARITELETDLTMANANSDTFSKKWNECKERLAVLEKENQEFDKTERSWCVVIAKMSNAISRDHELLRDCASAIDSAICGEILLDGAEGRELLKKIKGVLPKVEEIA